MISLFADSALWLKILLGIGALPLICFGLGLLVCLCDSTAGNMFEDTKWYQVLLGLTMFGIIVALVLSLIGGVTLAINAAMHFCFNNSNLGLSFVLGLVLVIGGIGIGGETLAYKASQKGQQNDAEQ